MIREDFDELFENNEFSNATGNKGKARGFGKGQGRALGRRAKVKKAAGYIPAVAAYRATVKAASKIKNRRSGFDGDTLDNTDFNMNF